MVLLTFKNQSLNNPNEPLKCNGKTKFFKKNSGERPPSLQTIAVYNGSCAVLIEPAGTILYDWKSDTDGISERSFLKYLLVLFVIVVLFSWAIQNEKKNDRAFIIRSGRPTFIQPI